VHNQRYKGNVQNKHSQLKRYLQETLGIEVNPTAWHGGRSMPFFLRNLYTFLEIQLVEVCCLLMLDRSEQEQSSATVRKHMNLVLSKWNGEVVYVRGRVSAYNRKRLIEHKVPFLVAGNQMYLPFLGIDLREHFKKIRAKVEKFSPSTQALVIRILLGGNIDRIATPAEMAQCLGYSPMTMTRAFNELESVGLGKISTTGRERHLKFIKPVKDIWKEAQPFLRSPVKKAVQIAPMDFEPLWPRAGLTALSYYSMLVEPANPAFALSKKDWKSLEQIRHVVNLPHKESGALEIEVWDYAPTLFARDKLVDRLSLYLSLKQNKNERVETALEEMMKDQQW